MINLMLRVMINEEKEVALNEPPNEKIFFKGISPF